MSAGRLVILSGPSGVGKDAVLDAWLAADPRAARVVTTTTRPPRPGEVDGRDYTFLPVDEFLRRADAGAFLEHKHVHGNHYASPVAGTEALLAAGRIAVLKIDVQGAWDVVARRPDALTIFLLPPSLGELERRIRGRGTEEDDVVRLRLRNAEDEISAAGFYRHHVVNDDLSAAVAEIMRVVS